MTRSVAEADAADRGRQRRAGVLLAVGHTERFNPAVLAARPLIHAPRFIEVHRLGTFPERSLDIDVVFDLMIHDLDLLLALVRQRGRRHRGRRRARADAAHRHRQRAAEVRQRLHRQPDRQPDQPRAGAQDPLLPAQTRTCRSTTRRRKWKRGGWCPRTGRCRESRAASWTSYGTSRSGANSRTSSPPCATGGRRRVTGEQGRAALALANDIVSRMATTQHELTIDIRLRNRRAAPWPARRSTEAELDALAGVRRAVPRHAGRRRAPVARGRHGQLHPRHRGAAHRGCRRPRSWRRCCRCAVRCGSVAPGDSLDVGRRAPCGPCAPRSVRRCVVTGFSLADLIARGVGAHRRTCLRGSGRPVWTRLPRRRSTSVTPGATWRRSARPACRCAR